VADRAKKIKLALKKDVPKLLADTFPDELVSELEKLAVLEVKLDLATVTKVINAKEATKTLAVHEFRTQKALEATRRYKESTVRREQKLLLEADADMKSGLEPRLTLERLILELCV
jgi:DNA polymerase III delta subunit